MTENPRAQNNIDLHSCEGARLEVLRLHDIEGISWPKIAQKPKYRGIPEGTLWSWARGKRNLPEKYKAQLGIPMTIPTVACPKHGVVHCYDCETQTVVKVKKPKPKTPRKPRPAYKPMFVQMGLLALFLLREREDHEDNN